VHRIGQSNNVLRMLGLLRKRQAYLIATRLVLAGDAKRRVPVECEVKFRDRPEAVLCWRAAITSGICSDSCAAKSTAGCPLAGVMDTLGICFGSASESVSMNFLTLSMIAASSRRRISKWNSAMVAAKSIAGLEG
jgi:hypothetical protein